MAIDVSVFDNRWNTIFKDLDALAQQIVYACIERNNYEISVVFAHDAIVQDLNKKYRGKDKPTNVLSLNYSDGTPFEMLIGEVILSFETISKESVEQKIDFIAHTKHLLVHGVLHILGYTHDKDDDFEAMEKKEIEILAKIG